MNAETIARPESAKLLDAGQLAYINDRLGTNFPAVATYNDPATSKPIFVGLAGQRRIPLPI